MTVKKTWAAILAFTMICGAATYFLRLWPEQFSLPRALGKARRAV